MKIWSRRIAQNMNKKNWKILPWILGAEFFKSFHSYFGQCDNFIFSFWNFLTFRSISLSFSRWHLVLSQIKTRNSITLLDLLPVQKKGWGQGGKNDCINVWNKNQWILHTKLYIPSAIKTDYMPAGDPHITRNLENGSANRF